MSTPIPENSVQTIGRLAWTGAKVAYGAALAGWLVSPCEREPDRTDDELVLDGVLADMAYDTTLDRACDLRYYIDAALALKPGAEYYAESADSIVEGLKILRSADCQRDVWDGPLEPAKRAELKRIAAWATEMLPIWKKIRVVRLRQQKIVQDEYLIKMGAKSRFWVWYGECDFQYDRAFKYFCRGTLAFIGLSLLVGLLFGKEAEQGLLEFGGAPLGWFVDAVCAVFGWLWDAVCSCCGLIKKIAIWFFFLGMD